MPSIDITTCGNFGGQSSNWNYNIESRHKRNGSVVGVNSWPNARNISIHFPGDGCVTCIHVPGYEGNWPLAVFQREFLVFSHKL